MDQPEGRRLQAQDQGDGQPLPVYRSLSVAREDAVARRLCAGGPRGGPGTGDRRQGRRGPCMNASWSLEGPGSVELRSPSPLRPTVLIRMSSPSIISAGPVLN